MRKIFVLPLALFLLAACSTPEFGMKPISEPMPKLAGPQVVSGEPTVTASLYQGKVLVVNFWASWCDPCRREAPILQSTWTRLQSGNVQFIGVDSRDNDAAGTAFIREFGSTYPSISDKSGKFAFSFGINAGLPGTVVVDSSGVMRYRKIGEISQADLNEMLAGVGVKVPAAGVPAFPSPS